MSKAFQVVRDFENALCAYTGAPFAVTTNSCTSALMLACAWHFQKRDPEHMKFWWHMRHLESDRSIYLPVVEIPKRTYVSVPMSIIHAGGRPTFRDEDWVGAYQLKPLPVWDSARWFTKDLWHGVATKEATTKTREKIKILIGGMVCVSFHWSKTLGIQQGGAILHDNPEADAWLRKARFDGRTEGVTPKMDKFDMIGWHCYMSPEMAAEGLVRLSFLPKHNPPIPNDDYPDLSQLEIFR